MSRFQGKTSHPLPNTTSSHPSHPPHPPTPTSHLSPPSLPPSLSSPSSSSHSLPLPLSPPPLPTHTTRMSHHSTYGTYTRGGTGEPGHRLCTAVLFKTCAQRVCPRLLRSSALLRFVGTLPARYSVSLGGWAYVWFGRVLLSVRVPSLTSLGDVPAFLNYQRMEVNRGGAALGAAWFLRVFPRLSLRRSHRLCSHSYSVLCLLRQRIQLRFHSTKASGRAVVSAWFWCSWEACGLNRIITKRISERIVARIVDFPLPTNGESREDHFGAVR